MKRSRQAGAPDEAEERALKEQFGAGWLPSTELLMIISRLIAMLEPLLNVTPSEGDSRRLAQRLVALRQSGLVKDEDEEGLPAVMKREDYELACRAAERHFLAAGHSLPAIQEAMARVSHQLNFEGEGDGSKPEGEKDDKPKAQGEKDDKPKAEGEKDDKPKAEGSKKWAAGSS